MINIVLLLTTMLPAIAWGLDVINLRIEDYRNPIDDIKLPEKPSHKGLLIHKGKKLWVK